MDSTKHTFNNKDVIILDKKYRWYERGMKEAIYVTKEQPSLNKGGALHHNLAGAYSSVITKIPKRFWLRTLPTSSYDLNIRS